MSPSARLGGRRGWLIIGGLGLVAVVVAAIGWWPSAGQDRESVDEFTHVHGLQVPAWDADRVYVATHEGLIGVDGAAWHWVGQQRHDFMGFVAHPVEQGVVYSSGHPEAGSDLANPVGFMVSSDGGATWQPRALAGQVDFHAMAVGGRGETVYGWNGVGEAGLYRSDDGGRQWHQPPADALHEVGGAFALAVSPTDADTVWAGTEAGLSRSVDGGRSWESVATGAAGPVTAVTVDPADDDRLMAYVVADDGGLVETRDGGATWSTLGGVADGDAVTQVAIHPDEPDRIYAGTAGADVVRSRDGGQTWEVLARAGRPARR